MTNLLDHGSLELIETWGSDERIIESARMSTDGSARGWGPIHTPECNKSIALWKDLAQCNCESKPGDEKLLRYLWEHNHLTPFEMCGATFEVKAPIMVFREWQRHRTQSYNEMSARYIPLPDESYMPSVERLLAPGGTNKQAGSTGAALTPELAECFLAALKETYAEVENTYQTALKDGVPKELARLVIPVGRYSKMRASANLRNWLAFLTLRTDPSAQWEIVQYAEAVRHALEQQFPRTMELFNGDR
ncbi:MAG: FAD-dependent thymidylate synthase [Actinobacteria bacterium]|nr:FAD-dependent thymidylate synthase [Actinomycetota bacterium]